MFATLCLISCALAAAQPPDRPEGAPALRLNGGQELVYRGTFVEEALGTGVQFSRSYRLEARTFVLEATPRGYTVAFLTVLKMRRAADRATEPDPTSVRLELVRADTLGRVLSDSGVSLQVPLEGPATVECEAFIELPRDRLSPAKPWEVEEAGRPPCSWRIVGTEVVNGATCFKLEGVQNSEDWDRPRADRTAWRRLDTVWLVPRTGVACQVERTIERREPARQQATHRSTIRYELESSLQYPGQFFEDRRREILQAKTFADAVAPLLSNAGRQGMKALETQSARIKQHLESQPPTPYRVAVEHVKRRLDAALRGETPVALLVEHRAPAAAVAALGQPAPDFLVMNMLTRESARLHRLLGKPIVMVFYHPQSPTADEVLRFAQSLQAAHAGAVVVLGLSVSDDAELLAKRHKELGFTFPILSGKGLRQTYAVDATPKLFVLDAAGIVRGSYTGWGPEIPTEVAHELKLWLRAPRPPER